ncbi:MAG: GNAT family N-acetyltransferase [Thermodesulfobacteriota bacterium]
MVDWKHKFASRFLTPEQAAEKIKNGDRVFLGSLCAEPGVIIDAIGKSYVEDVELIQFVTGPRARALLNMGHHRFSMKTFFVGHVSRQEGGSLEANYVPLFHSRIPEVINTRRIPIDVAVVQVSEPDRFGRFSLGVSVDVGLSAVRAARIVIAQVNAAMPRTFGDTLITADDVDFLVEHTEDLCELQPEILGEIEKRISHFCGELIEDGSILHFGFAGISQGLMDHLKDIKNLGVHTEVYTDALMDLTESGAINNSTKKMYRGKSLASRCMGTRRLYDYVHENALVEFHPSDVILNPAVIGSHDRMIAINVAVQVDLRGQIRQGSPTWTAFEGSGGDHDFMRGASLSRGGRSIVCLRSTSLRSSRSTIVPSFGPKAAVIMNRGEVNYIITEYGVAYIGGRTLRERAMSLIEIAHPDHREDLMAKAREMGYVYSNQYYVRTASPELRRRVRTDRVFKGDLKAHIRVIKPTDEAMIRDLFYDLSQESVYFRYFSPRRSMPHDNLQRYVNLKEEDGLSLVVTIGPRENRRIIAEGRYLVDPTSEYPEVAFMVAEEFQGRGIASFLLEYMTEIAKEQGYEGFRADVLMSNSPMIRVIEGGPYVVHKRVSDGVLTLTWRFDELKTETQWGR